MSQSLDRRASLRLGNVCPRRCAAEFYARRRRCFGDTSCRAARRFEDLESQVWRLRRGTGHRTGPQDGRVRPQVSRPLEWGVGWFVDFAGFDALDARTRTQIRASRAHSSTRKLDAFFVYSDLHGSSDMRLHMRRSRRAPWHADSAYVPIVLISSLQLRAGFGTMSTMISRSGKTMRERNGRKAKTGCR